MNSLTISFVSLGMIRSPRADEACRYDGDRVSCSVPGFRRLTDTIIEQRGEIKKQQIRMADLAEAVNDADALYHSCEARLAAIPPPPPPKSPLWPTVGVGAAVLGAFAVSASAMGPVPDTVRFPVSMIGILLIGTGVGLAWP